jgi:hypothetical protein
VVMNVLRWMLDRVYDGFEFLERHGVDPTWVLVGFTAIAIGIVLCIFLFSPRVAR